MKKYFNKALFFENLKRFWPVSVVGFITIYLSGLDYLRQRTAAKLHIPYSTMDAILTSRWFWTFFGFVIAFVAAFVVFDYLHHHKDTNMLHAMPMNRTSLFVTSYLSGTVLYLIPLFLTVIFLFIFKTPTYYGNDWYDADVLGPDIYTTTNILAWLWQNFIYEFFTFSFTTVGLIVTGSSVIAALTGICANFIIPSIILCFLGFASDSYWGFTIDDQIYDILCYTTPFAQLIDYSSENELLGQFGGKFGIYLIVAIAISILAYVLYRIRKNEKVEDAYAFKFFESFVGFLFVFIPATIGGLVLNSVWGKMSYVYGGFIGFVIGQMITRKTFRIIDKKGIKNFIIFGLIMALIIVSFSFDLFGYEKNVPSLNNVKSASVESYALRQWPGDGMRTFKAENEDDIADVIALHQSFVDDRDTFYSNNSGVAETLYSNGSWDVEITYVLKSGVRMMRSYSIPVNYLKNSSTFEKIYNKLSNGEDYIGNMDALKNIDLDISGGLYKPINEEYREFYLDTYNFTKEQQVELIEALQKDMRANSKFAYLIDGYGGYGEVIIYAKVSDLKIDEKTIAGYEYQTYYQSEILDDDGAPNPGYDAVLFVYHIDPEYIYTINFIESLGIFG